MLSPVRSPVEGDAMNSPDGHDEDLRGLLGWLVLVLFFVVFAAMAFWFLNSVDDRERRADTAGASSSAEAHGEVDTDGLLRDRVHRELDRRYREDEDPLNTDPTSLEISVSGGTVWLRGDVSTEAERQRVLAAARTLPGVARVVNSLRVISPDPEPAPAAAAEDAPEAEPTVDEIRAALEALYEEYGIEGSPELVDGVWLLGGLAPDDAAKSELVGAARRVEGVDRTRDQLVVSGSPGSPATELSTVLAVDAGQVVLSGSVPSEEARAVVLEVAQTVFGAGNVVDELVVDPDAEGRVVVTGDVAAGQQDELGASLAGAAAAVGLTVDDQANYVQPSDEQVALQTELDAAVAGVVINFASGSSVLSASESAKLDPLLQVLLGASGVLVAIEGHTDDQGDAAANQVLSQERAQAVVDYLSGEGVDPALLRATGNGESQPIADNTTAAGRAENRRTEFRVVI